MFNSNDFEVLKVDEALKKQNVFDLELAVGSLNKIVIQVPLWGSLRYMWRSICCLSITFSKELALS